MDDYYGFIKTTGECVIGDICCFMTDKYGITECKVKNICKVLKKKGDILQYRGYRRNIFYAGSVCK